MVKTEDELERKLRNFVELVSKSFRLEAVVLFGSYAGGNPNEYSDIDVALFSPDFGNNPIEEMTALCKLRRKIDTDIEPLPFAAGEFYKHTSADFVNEILKYGRVIYECGKMLI